MYLLGKILVSIFSCASSLAARWLVKKIKTFLGKSKSQTHILAGHAGAKLCSLLCPCDSAKILLEATHAQTRRASSGLWPLFSDLELVCLVLAPLLDPCGLRHEDSHGRGESQ